MYPVAQLYTPFRHRAQKDDFAEGNTVVDGIARDFHIVDKSGVALSSGLTYLGVLEAKMRSVLSAKTTHAKGYDQVSRTGAYMIHALLGAESRAITLLTWLYCILASMQLHTVFAIAYSSPRRVSACVLIGESRRLTQPMLCRIGTWVRAPIRPKLPIEFWPDS
jgi:hypothetical protein